MKLLLFGVLTLLALSTSCNKKSLSEFNPLDVKSESSSPEDHNSVTHDYLDLANARRASLGLNPLTLQTDLSDLAINHSKNMATGKVSFGHTGFSERCDSARDIMGGGNLCGEIVASGQDTATEVFGAWMASSGHRQKIEEGRYTHTGFGYYKNSKGEIYWTQIFLEVN